MFQEQYCILYDIIMLHMSRLFCLLTLLTISDKYIKMSDCRFRKDNAFMKCSSISIAARQSNVQVKLYNNFSHNVKKVLLFLIYSNILQQLISDIMGSLRSEPI